MEEKDIYSQEYREAKLTETGDALLFDDNDELQKKDKININIKVVQDGLKAILDGKTVGHIYAGHFSYDGVESDNHLDMYVDDSVRRKGVGQQLIKEYKNRYGLPNEEYTKKKSKLLFMQNIAGYRIVGKFIESMYQDYNSFDDEIIKNTEDELPYVYKLEKIK